MIIVLTIIMLLIILLIMSSLIFFPILFYFLWFFFSLIKLFRAAQIFPLFGKVLTLSVLTLPLCSFYEFIKSPG